MSGVIASMTTVFTEVMTWIITAIQSVIAVFYVVPEGGGAGELTFLGCLALVALSISIFFLLVGVITNFLKLRN